MCVCESTVAVSAELTKFSVAYNKFNYRLYLPHSVLLCPLSGDQCHEFYLQVYAPENIILENHL